VTIRWEAAGASDVGRHRRGNEDAFFLDTARGIFIVADGMGGHAAGEIASDLAVRTATRVVTVAVDQDLATVDLAAPLASAFESAWQKLKECCARDPRTRGMGTTLTACILTRDGSFRIGHIGDSRAYRFRDGQAELLTVDHTWVQGEIEGGRLTREAADSHPLSHILSRVLSPDLPPDPDLIAGSLQPGDILLLSSDGLHGLIPDDEMREIATRGEPPTRILASLIDSANRHGGRDNITGVVVRILPDISDVV
jgi:PPM family protein phosphatase